MKPNPKIQELINLSTERVELNIRGDDTIDTEMVFNKEKFAELIVNECATILDTKIQPPSHPFNSIGHKLKEHFGIDQ